MRLTLRTGRRTATGLSLLLVVAVAGIPTTASGAPATSAAHRHCAHAVATDFDGDGHADVAVVQGHPSDDDELPATAISVVYGSAMGLRPARNQLFTAASFAADVKPGDAFGMNTAVTTGDFNGDCIADLAVGLTASGQSVTGGSADNGFTYNGGVLIMYGSPTGLSVANSHIFDGSQLFSDPMNSNVAAGIIAGNFNGDRYDDLVIGQANDSAAGVFYGSATGLTTKHHLQITEASLGSSTNEGIIGGQFAVGDFNGDGYGDLALGAPGTDTDGVLAAGAVAVVYGSPSGLRTSRHQWWSEASPGVPGTPERADNLGSALTAGDFNGDGRSDLVIGVPAESIGTLKDAGEIIVLYGSTTGLTAAGDQVIDQDTAGVPGTTEAGDLFGVSEATGDLNHDGYADLAAGVPFESIGTLEGAGYVDVLYGSPRGLTGTHAQGWSQNSAGVLGTSEALDTFGRRLLIANTTSPSYPDLVIGVPDESTDHFDNGAIAVLHGSSHRVTAAGNVLFDSSGLVGGASDFEEFGDGLA